jgi:hypothetical protein
MDHQQPSVNPAPDPRGPGAEWETLCAVCAVYVVRAVQPRAAAA